MDRRLFFLIVFFKTAFSISATTPAKTFLETRYLFCSIHGETAVMVDFLGKSLGEESPGKVKVGVRPCNSTQNYIWTERQYSLQLKKNYSDEEVLLLNISNEDLKNELFVTVRVSGFHSGDDASGSYFSSVGLCKYLQNQETKGLFSPAFYCE